MTTLQSILAAANWNVRVNENFKAVSPAAAFGIKDATTTGLTLGYYGGILDGVSYADGTHALTASTTRYVVAARASGTVSSATGTTNWNDSTNYKRMGVAVVGASTITSWTDWREYGAGAGGGGGSFTGGTLASALNEAPAVTIASSSTVNIGAAAANTITVSGTTTITAFDTIAASAVRRVVFSGILTLTHNATSLILPTGANITTAAGDAAEFVSLGSGNWRCVNYLRASGQALATAGGGFTGGTLTSALNEAPQVTLASASTVNIGAAAANSVSVSGTTTITAFDTIASGALRRIVFQGALTLTHSGTALILPGGANITTAAGDVAWMESLGSGNWRCVSYNKASGAAVTGGGGGGGLTNWTESVNTTSPNATKPVVAFTSTNAATDVDAAIVPKGNGAVMAAIPDGATTGGNKRGQNSVDWQTDRFANTHVASGAYSVVAGGSRNTASGSTSFVGGGSTNVASSVAGVVMGGGTNTASGVSYSVVCGGNNNTASGQWSTVPGGFVCNATGDASFAMGYRLTADASFSGAVGRWGTTRGVIASMVHANGNYLSGSGDAQVRRFVFIKATTSATPDVLLADGSSASSSNSVVLQNNSTYTFSVYIAAHNKSNNDSAGWKIEGLVKRTSNAASTTFVGTPTVTLLGADSGASSWAVAAIANTTLGGFDIQVTGAASTNINWVAGIKTVEVVA